MSYSDFTITEAGFGCDLGAEKFFDIKCREANITPSAVVIVATIRALKMHGGVLKENLNVENVEALKAGFKNLEKHIDTVKKFGLPYVVAINRFTSDTEAELNALEEWSKENGHPVSLSEVWAKGGDGAIDLAKKVIAQIDNSKNEFKFIYDTKDTIKEKIAKICKEVYGADGVEFTQDAKNQIARLTKLGFGESLVCMAKTQYSLSDNPKLLGRPEGFTVTIRSVTPSIGAGFIVALSGDIIRMPGLPKEPAAERMDIVDGKIVGLF
jgi:formate--tetrahydrofolate ligase